MIRPLYRMLVPSDVRAWLWRVRKNGRSQMCARLFLANRTLRDRMKKARYGLLEPQLRQPEGFPGSTWAIETNANNTMRRWWIRQAVSGDVLDVGCGHGYTTCDMASVARHVTALDISEDHLGSAEALATLNAIKNVDFAIGDCYLLPFNEREFDVVCLLEVLEHLEHPRAAVSEALRVTRRRVVVTVPAHGHMTDAVGHINDFRVQDLTEMFPGTCQVITRIPFTFLVYDLPREDRD